MSKWISPESLDYKELRYLSVADLRAALEAAPGLEIVRCEDCMYRWVDTDTGAIWCNRLTGTFRVTADSFCSFGKEREC